MAMFLLIVLISGFFILNLFSVPGWLAQAFGFSDFNIAAVGDWGCNPNTDATVNNMVERSPELVLALGDYSYQATATCWFFKTLPIDNITKITIGNHEDEVGEGFEQYMNHFKLTSPYYSYNYQNLHIIIMSTSLDYSIGSEQYDFVVSDLQSASQDPTVNWIIVSPHYWMYRSSNVSHVSNDLAEIYHPVFDKYQVDLVLSGDIHNYQRTYPMRYNPNNISSPIIDNKNPNRYVDPEGTIFIIVGTGGINRSPLKGTSPFVVQQQDDYYGHLDIKFTNEGNSIEGKFYKNGDGMTLDSFFITKFKQASDS
jgi:hypothetical protein